MSFSWKGLLGVNQSSAPSSTSAPSAPGSHQASASPASHALPIGTPGSSVGGSVASPTSAGSSAMSPPSARAPLNSNPFAAAQPAAPAVPLFGGMIPSSNSFHSTSYIPSSSATTQSSVISRKPSEIPVNAAEGGGYLLGMENFGNTCYVNSMLQSLYFCRPFRDSVLSYNVAHRDRSESDPDHPRSHHDSVDSSAPTPLNSTSEPVDGIPPADTLFAALRDLFEVIQQSGHQKSLSSPTRLTAPGSLPLSSPITPSPPSLGSADPPNVARRTSILGRPSTAGGIAGRGGAGNHIAANQAGSTAAAAAQAIPIAASSSAGAAPPTLSVSTSSTGTLALGFPAVDSNAVKAFLGTLKRENVLFDSTMHQDAHEMLNFVLNKVGEDLIDADKARTRVKMQSRNPYLNARSESDKTVDAHRRKNVMEVGPSGKTCVHRLFEGVLTNETRCLTCETITSRDECFLDLSIDIEQNSSVTSCLRQFSASEMLRSRNKFFCDSCSGLQEAEKRMKIKKLPNLLALHLKRFKYEETVQRYVKLAYRVVFPLELRLFNTSDDAEDPDRLYELCAIVVHIGAGPHHGHYIAVVKVGDRWVQFDDDVVTYIDEAEIAKYYGDRPGLGSAYVLFYQAVDLDFDGLGLVDPAIQATIQQKMATNGRTNGRGRAGSTTTEPIDARQHVPSPERAGGAALPNRSRLDSVTEGSPLVAGGAGGSGGAEAGQGANGWFGSFRNRDKRAGSQSKRRPKTTSSVDPLPAGATVVLASAASADPTKLGLGDVEGTTPDNASISTHSTSANEGVPRGITTASASITPSTELTGSAILPGSQAADGEADASPARHGAMTTTPASEVLSSRGTTESPSESKYSRMIGNQADAAANREAREQNLMRGIMNRRARAASEGFPSPGVLSEAAWGTTGPLLSHGQPMLGGGLVADPEEAAHAGHAAHTVVTPSAIDSGASPASTFPIASQREGPSGPSFAPLERLLSKKDAKTRNARRASSGYTPMSPGTEKKEGMLSNLFSSSSSTSSAAQSKRNSMQQMPAGSPSEGGAAAGDALPPSRKPSITTRTISKTFGFGRKQT